MDCREFALLKHGEQKYDKHDYIFHLDQVYNYSFYIFKEKYRELIYLHDVLEDTDTSEDELFYYFGKETTKSVKLISDDSYCESRKEKKILMNKRLKNLSPDIKQELAVLCIKPVDRYLNMLYSFESNNIKKIKMYVAEYPSFREACYRSAINDKVWKDLDSLFLKMAC